MTIRPQLILALALPLAALGPATARADAASYKVTFDAPKECKVGSECVATARLEALTDFHINDNYPYKLKLEETAGVEFLGKDAAGKNVFSKQAGDFKKEGEKVATLTVRFKATKAGSYTVKGTYKLSVCSEKSCQLETQDLQTAVTVK